MTDFDKQITTLSPARHRVAVTQLVNHERTQHGLRPLLPSRQLGLSARAWALVEVRKDGVLSHGNFARRALRFPFVVAGRPRTRRAVGENIGWGTAEFSTPREIVDAWMHSPGHRANILRPWRWGAVSSSRNGDAVLVVQHFGRDLR